MLSMETVVTSGQILAIMEIVPLVLLHDLASAVWGSMEQLGISLLCGFIGIVVLRVFYGAVKVEWPSNYVTRTRDFGLIVNRTFKRYVLFILAPVYLIALLMSTITRREGGFPWLVALAIGLGHAFKNHGGTVVASFRHGDPKPFSPDMLVQLGLFFFALTAAMAGGLGPGPFQFVVPPIDEFFKALWTAVIVSIIGIVVLERMKSHKGVGDLSRTAVRELDRSLIRYGKERALSAGADQSLVLAIMMTENLQRPAWYRRFENFKGVFFPKGSYGVMQVTSPKPITDRESIDLAIEKYLKDVQISVDLHGRPGPELRQALVVYNPNPAFVDLAEGLYEWVRGSDLVD
jgi:hypothetical protein